MIGRGVHCWGDNNLLSGVQLWVVLHPSLHLLNLVVDHFSAAGFQGCCFALDWSKIFLMPSYMPLRMPAVVTELPPALVAPSSCSLLYFAPGWSDSLEGLLNWWALVFSNGSTLCNNNRNQLLRLGFKPVAVLWGPPPKGSKSWFLNCLMQVVPWPRSGVALVACRQIIFKRLCESSSFSKCCIMFLSVRGFPKCLKQLSFSGGGLILQHVSERLESQSALWYERVRSTCLELYV